MTIIKQHYYVREVHSFEVRLYKEDRQGFGRHGAHFTAGSEKVVSFNTREEAEQAAERLSIIDKIEYKKEGA